MRNKPRNWLMALAIAIVVVLGAMVWWAMPPKEPVYKGKPLTYWLSAYGWVLQPDTVNSRPTEPQAAEAVRAVGTNAFPTLLHMLKEKDSPMKERFALWASRYHGDLAKVHLKFRRPYESGLEATQAFERLGPQPVNLAPEFTRVYDLNANATSRQHAVMCATYASPKAKETLSLLLRAIADTNDFFLRIDGAVALGKIHAPPDVAVPALIKALSDPEDPVRAEAAMTLGEYGIEAKAAVPELQKLMDAELARGASTNASPIGILAWGFCTGDVRSYKANKSWSPLKCDLYAAAQNALSKINRAVTKAESKKAFESSSQEPLEPR